MNAIQHQVQQTLLAAPRMRTTLRLSDSERLRIVRLHKQGKSHRQIEQEVGRSRITIGKVLRQAAEIRKGWKS